MVVNYILRPFCFQLLFAWALAVRRGRRGAVRLQPSGRVSLDSDCAASYLKSLPSPPSYFPATQEIPSWSHAAWLDCERENGWPDRPLKDTWRYRLDANIEAARKDPCNADVLVSTGPYDLGFGAKMASFVNSAWLAVVGNNSIAVCMSNDFMKDVWGKWFVNKFNFAECHELCTPSGNTGPEEHARFSGLLETDSQYMQDLKRFLFPELLAWTTETQRSIEETLASSGLHTPYLGVHIRHGDKGREAELLPVRKYAEEIKALLETHHLNSVFLATDDRNAKAELQAELNVPVIANKPLEGNSYAWRTAPGDAAVPSQLTLFADLEALRRAKIFVGTGSSSLGRAVYFLRGANESYSLDRPFGDHVA